MWVELVLHQQFVGALRHAEADERGVVVGAPAVVGVIGPAGHPFLAIDPVLRADDERRLGDVQHAGAARGVDLECFAVERRGERPFTGDLYAIAQYDSLLFFA